MGSGHGGDEYLGVGVEGGVGDIPVAGVGRVGVGRIGLARSGQIRFGGFDQRHEHGGIVGRVGELGGMRAPSGPVTQRLGIRHILAHGDTESQGDWRGRVGADLPVGFWDTGREKRARRRMYGIIAKLMP